jgi:hypothetical protein
MGRYFSLTDVGWGCATGFFGGSFANLVIRAEDEASLVKLDNKTIHAFLEKG